MATISSAAWGAALAVLVFGACTENPAPPSPPQAGAVPAYLDYPEETTCGAAA